MTNQSPTIDSADLRAGDTVTLAIKHGGTISGVLTELTTAYSPGLLIGALTIVHPDGGLAPWLERVISWEPRGPLTAEELDAMPPLSVVVDEDKHVWAKGIYRPNEWALCSPGNTFASATVARVAPREYELPTHAG